MVTSQLQCSGCDAIVSEDELLSFACPARGTGDVDHVLRVHEPRLAETWPGEVFRPDANPFTRYRRSSYSYQLGRARGMTDSDYLRIVSDLGQALASIDRPLQITPLVRADALNTWVKNETVNVSGSHKARHLVGTAIHLAIAEHVTGKAIDAPLAIASCGNAALAAAVVAKAAGRTLRVFVPPSADSSVVARLDALGAERVTCERRPEEAAGDPCYLRFREAVSRGALPFSCQGGDNALALIGGHTLGWELIEQCRDAPVDHIVVQVGGGALASSLMQAFAMALQAGVISAMPRFHAVQTDNAHPLARAWSRLQDADGDLDYARTHRSEFMWPWESPPSSIAGGILDDETYDWFSIVTHLQVSHGSVITVSETELRAAQELAQSQTGIPVCHTGASGFAGLVKARALGDIGETDSTLVLFTGVIR